MKILADASLPNISSYFKEPFILNLYRTKDELIKLLPTHDVLFCRSTLTVTKDLLDRTNLQCVATASSGVDHIDVDYLKSHKITLLDAKGCNARAVADYVVATLACLYRNNLMIGKRAGIIGMGKVGTQVLQRLLAMGFDVIVYDPPRARADKDHPYVSLTDLTSCDLLCVHANLHQTKPDPSANLLSADFLSQLKPGVVLINASRGGIVNETDLLKTNILIKYCTDVYLNEPHINSELVNYSTLCTPHIAGHSIEAKQRAVAMIGQQLHQYYGVKENNLMLRMDISSVLLNNTNWIDSVLDIYNPMDDTLELKKSTNKTKAFLKQRQAHQNRHDFNCYNISKLPTIEKKWLGQ
jgi:erythronate-4-phosphate dehydrogenase